MSIEFAILGMLDWRPLSGYDLKKMFEDSVLLYWSGNNNQIYRTLVKLHREGLATCEVAEPESGPSRKVYAITEQGRAALKQWVQSRPPLPEVRQPFLVQLAKDHGGTPAVVRDTYLDPQLARSPREAFLWKAIHERGIAFYEQELAWVRRLRATLRETRFVKKKG